MRKEKVDIIAVQETHTEENLQRRGTMPGYVFNGVIYSSVHGIATYDKVSLSNDYHVLYQEQFQG
jgi:exonuclease III